MLSFVQAFFLKSWNLLWVKKTSFSYTKKERKKREREEGREEGRGRGRKGGGGGEGGTVVILTYITK